MRFSDLLKWGDGESSGSSFWSLGSNGKGKKAAAAEAVSAPAPAPALQGGARLHWVEEGRPRRSPKAVFADGEALLQLGGDLAAGTPVWVSPERGKPLAAAVESCAAEGGATRVRLSTDRPRSDAGGAGGVSLQMIGADGTVLVQRARIAASSSAGKMEALTAQAIDRDALVLVETGESCCLGVVRDCRGEDALQRVEIEAVGRACRI